MGLWEPGLTRHDCGMLRQIIQALERAPAMFWAAQKLWADPHLTVCGWYSGGLMVVRFLLTSPTPSPLKMGRGGDKAGGVEGGGQ